MSARTIEDVLAEHYLIAAVGLAGGSWECSCDGWATRYGSRLDHRAHVAAALREWLLSDETVERAARGCASHNDYDGCFDRDDPADEEDRQWWRAHVRAALAAATEEPS